MTRSARVDAWPAEAKVHHLRREDWRHEDDLTVRRHELRVVALEVMLSPVVDDSDVEHVLRLCELLKEDLLYGAVITSCQQAYRRARRHCRHSGCLLTARSARARSRGRCAVIAASAAGIRAEAQGGGACFFAHRCYSPAS